MDGGKENDRAARARLLKDLSLMGRMQGRLQRLCDCVERREMTAETALRGFRLAIEAALEGSDPEPASARFVGTGLAAAEREELERLRARVLELEQKLAAAELARELHEAAAAELEGALSTAREPVENDSGTTAQRVCRPSVPPPEKTDDPVEDWRAHISNFFLLYGFDAAVPRSAVTVEELAKGRDEGRELIYRPPDVRVPYEELMVANGLRDHSTLREGDRELIGFSPTGEGYWFWAEATESVPRQGKSFKDFAGETLPGWEILSLEEYFLTFAVMRDIHCKFLDVDEPVCLRTAHGEGEVLQTRSHLIRGGVELIVRSLPRAFSFKNLGARYRRLVPSVRLPD